MLPPDDAIERVVRPFDPIMMLPTPAQFRAELLAAAEAGDEKAAWFLLTFVSWFRHASH